MARYIQLLIYYLNNKDHQYLFHHFLYDKIDIVMNKYYQNISLLLRLTEHDGLSNMVLESLAWNKHVVWTYKFPFVHKVNRNLNEVQQIINELKNNNSNSGASNWIKENFNYDSFLNSLEGLYNNPTSPIKKASY